MMFFEESSITNPKRTIEIKVSHLDFIVFVKKQKKATDTKTET